MAEPVGERPPRPRPVLTPDIAWWFDACREHRLLIQRCVDCAALRHPPEPCCPQCRSFAWDSIEASGRAKVHSFVVTHYPQLPAFEYPLLVGLVDLEEGVRLVANLIDVDGDSVTIDMPVRLTFVDHDPDLSLPAFRPIP